MEQIKQYKKVSGVWAIRGKFKESDKWVWLNVANTDDIGSEIGEDLMFMNEEFENILHEQTYITKWNEEMCKYVDYKYSPRRVAVWKKIKEYLKDNCDCYEIVCIAKGTEQNLGEIERKFGFKYKVLFWSDRKHYEGTQEKIEERRKKYVKENKLEIDEKKYEVIYKCVI